jgi:hypothetical protein
VPAVVLVPGVVFHGSSLMLRPADEIICGPAGPD